MRPKAHKGIVPKNDTRIVYAIPCPIIVGYIETNEPQGKYRWWTPPMKDCGQFGFANTEDEIRELALKEFHNMIKLEECFDD